jgi:predicted AAA+ superfamily ATPase
MVWLPFEEIAEGKIVEALYAADLWAVYTGRAAERYADPNKFFERTYFTSSLRSLLSALARRLSGDPNINPITLILTGLGGGKTHSLIAAYHLTKNGSVLSDSVAASLEREGIRVPADVRPVVVVFDGAQIDPKFIMERYGRSALWSYIFGRLYEETGDGEFRRALETYVDVYPGAEKIYELFERLEAAGRPLVLLIDETLNFLKNLDRDQREKTRLFIQGLTKALTQLRRSYMAMTLLDTEEAREIAEGLRAVVQRISRNESMITLQELPAVIRRALLREASNSREEAKRLYDKYEENRQSLGERWTLETLIDHYPIHPTTIALFSKLAENGVIQATRDVLRILAWTLHVLYQQGRTTAFILPGDIPIEREEIRHAVFKDPQFRLAIEQDLRDVEALEKLLRVDSVCGKLVKRIYRSVALATVAYGYISERDVAAYVYSPDLSVSPLVLPTCIKEHMTGYITHLHVFTREGMPHYAVKSKAFWRSILRRRVEELRQEGIEEKVLEVIKRRVDRYAKRLRTVYVWETPKDEPGLVLVFAGIKRDDSADDPTNLISKREDGGPRIYQGAVVVAKPDEKAAEQAMRLALELMAIKEILNKYKEYGLDEQDLPEIKKYEEQINEQLDKIVAKDLYTTLVYAKGEGVYTSMAIPLDLSQENIEEKIKETLKNDGKLAEKIAPKLLRQVVESLYNNRGSWPTYRELVEYFGGKLTDVPILMNPKRDLAASIREGNFVVIRGGVALREYATIEDDDQIALPEAAPPPPTPETSPANTATPSPVVAIQVSKSAYVKLKTLRELVEKLPQYNKVKVIVKHTAEKDAVEDASALFKTLADKLRDLIKETRIIVEVTTEGGARIAKVELESSTNKTIDAVREIASSTVDKFSRMAKIILNYTIVFEGDGRKIAETLNTPFTLERFKKVAFDATLEEVV